MAGHSAVLLISVLRRQELEEPELEASLGYMARCWGREENKKKGSKGGVEGTKGGWRKKYSQEQKTQGQKSASPMGHWKTHGTPPNRPLLFTLTSKKRRNKSNLKRQRLLLSLRHKAARKGRSGENRGRVHWLPWDVQASWGGADDRTHSPGSLLSPVHRSHSPRAAGTATWNRCPEEVKLPWLR